MQRKHCVGAAFILSLLVAPTLSRAQSAIIYGSLGNFDISNDTGETCHGFEIEIEGVSSSAVQGGFSAVRYGAPAIIPYATGVRVRWESPYNALAYGVAFLFGFSERAFNTVLSQLEDKVINMSGQTGSAASKPTIATTSPLKPGQIGQQYAVPLFASGGKPNYIWTSTSGTLRTYG